MLKKTLFSSFLFVLFINISAFAGSLDKNELEQRKLVSRFFEILESVPARCPEEYKNTIYQSVTNFEKAHPELIRQLQSSRYRPYAIENYESNEEITKGDCEYIKSIIDFHVESMDGKQDIKRYLSILKGNG